MENPSQKKGAMEFAAAYAEALSAALAGATGAEWPHEVIETGRIPANDAPAVQFRLTVEGALRGECFIEFYEPQVADLLTKILKQPVGGLSDAHKAFFTKFVLSTTEQLGSSSLSRFGALNFRAEAVSGLAFGGMFVVPITASEGESELHVLLYFGPELLDSLSAAPGAGITGEAEPAAVRPDNLKLVMDVELNVSLRFGQRQLPLREVLELANGSIVELDRMVDEPVELYLDGKLIALGEAVVVDGNYGLRVTQIPRPIASHLMN
ncbi:MAG: FliM/FliN family flagellar motor switch protein [Terracidiphilus sp.]|jgi:flagellar motor switch protein FliN/FliY